MKALRRLLFSFLKTQQKIYRLKKDHLNLNVSYRISAADHIKCVRLGRKDRIMANRRHILFASGFFYCTAFWFGCEQKARVSQGETEESAVENHYQAQIF